MGKRSAQIRRLSRINMIEWPECDSVTLDQAAELICYKPLAVRRMLERKELKASCKDHGNIRIATRELKRWVNVQVANINRQYLSRVQASEAIEQITARLGL